jgi:hypothetical protein
MMGTKIKIELEIEIDELDTGKMAIIWATVPGLSKRYAVYEGQVFSKNIQDEPLLDVTMRGFLERLAVTLRNADERDARSIAVENLS